MAYSRPEPLSEDHRLERFESGEPSLDDWLRRRARRAEADRTARVYVATAGEDGDVVGYYALAAAAVEPARATRRLLKGQPRTRPVPALLVARLAVDRGHQRKGLGRSLLKDALVRCEAAAEQIGARAVIVHALNAPARSFYERFGFEPSPTDPLHLILLVKDLKALAAHAQRERPRDP